MISFIVNVKLDSLAHLGKILIFYKKLFVFLHIVAVMLFLSAVFSFYGQSIEKMSAIRSSWAKNKSIRAQVKRLRISTQSH